MAKHRATAQRFTARQTKDGAVKIVKTNRKLSPIAKIAHKLIDKAQGK